MPRAHASSPRLEPHTVSPHKSGHWQEISIIVTVQIATGPTQLAKPKKPRCNKNTVDELKCKELVTMVYGEHPGHYAEGEWTNNASELMASVPSWNSKHKEMAGLTEKVSPRKPC
jgi:hypothetical protein